MKQTEFVSKCADKSAFTALNDWRELCSLYLQPQTVSQTVWAQQLEMKACWRTFFRPVDFCPTLLASRKEEGSLLSLESSLADQLLENEKTTEGVVFVIKQVLQQDVPCRG